MKITDIKLNPRNPRVIKDHKFKQLVKSIEQFPRMMELRPIIVDENGVIQGGNMRFRAIQELGIKEIPECWVKQASDLTPEQWKEFVVKDNISFGEWDMDLLAGDYDLDQLIEWGMDPFALGDDAEARKEEAHVKLSERFIVPPFSLLDTTQQYWQERKDLWKQIGIKSELGREGGLTFAASAQSPVFYEVKNALRDKGLPHQTDDVFAECIRQGIKLMGDEEGSTSIFDPVLCEIMYQWFTPEKGSILDPFAGGSVRGIVAAKLGFSYFGNDLRAEQIEANRANATEVLTHGEPLPTWTTGDSLKIDELVSQNIPGQLKQQKHNGPEYKRIKISNKSLKQKFQPCEPEYIKNVCHGRCCEGSNGLMVTVHDSEIEQIEALGVEVKDNFIVDKANTGICPFKKNHLCSIHESKPFGCKASPYTLNKNDTLIIRNRYRLLKCYNTPEAIPAYKAHGWSLRQIFKKNTDKLIEILESTDEDFYFDIEKGTYEIIVDNDIAKHTERQTKEPTTPENIIATTGDEVFDFVFSCPPYADLEVYSQDPADLSNKDYIQFLKLYREIIQKSVALLKPNRFAAFVIGDVRDKKGIYYNFISDTIAAFQDAGAYLYNEFILINAIGSAAIRANKQFNSGRKNVKRHQNVLVFYKDAPEKAAKKLKTHHDKVIVFYKGDPAAIKYNFGTIDLTGIDPFTYIDQEAEQ